MMRRTALPIVAVLSLAGCALTSKGPALTPRFFSPETAARSPEARMATGRNPTADTAEIDDRLELRLGSVEAASYLEERIAYRLNAAELGYYDDRRWTERPDEYVRRALERELFERRRVRRIVAGLGNTLDVELTAFEELRTRPPRVRLALRFTLHDDRQATLERSLVVERELASGQTDHARGVALALGRALEDAMSELGDEVTQKLAAHPATTVATDGSAP